MKAIGHNGQGRDDGLREPGTALAASWATRACAVSFWLSVWQLASVALGSTLLLAGPIDTLLRLRELVVQPPFLATVTFSLRRIVGGFALAYACGVVLAMAAHRWRALRLLLEPAVSALKSVPIACVIVLLLIWVGSRRVSGIAVFLAIFPAVYYSCLEGLRHVDVDVSEMLEVFDVRGPVRLCVHVWPQVLPYLVGTSKNVCGMAWKSGVAAELIGSPMGSIGERIYQAKILLETADLFAWTIVVVALSVACEWVFVTLLARSGSFSYRLALSLSRLSDAASVQRQDAVPASIVLEHSALGYDGEPVVHDASVALGPGERGVLADASGAGKTTLLRTVAALQPALAAEDIELPACVSMVFQEARLIDALDAVDNVVLVAGPQADDCEIREALLELLPPQALDVPVGELSGGQRRRVELARALVSPSSAVLLDEPFASLDDQAHRRAARFVRDRLGCRTLLVASHMPGDAELLEARELHL